MLYLSILLRKEVRHFYVVILCIIVDVFVSGAQLLAQHINISLRRFTAICEYEDEHIKSIYSDISPYLYPFSVEFSILIGEHSYFLNFLFKPAGPIIETLSANVGKYFHFGKKK